MTDVQIPIYGYATHLVPLVTALSLTDGPVLECGGGLISTHVLNLLCLNAIPKRPVLTLEENEAWFKKLHQHYNVPGHEVQVVKDQAWSKAEQLGQKWSVALIDNEDVESLGRTKFDVRKGLAKTLRPNTDIIVIHDADFWWFTNDAEWMKFVRSFENRMMYQMVGPGTLMLSDKISFDGMCL